ncbi:MAG: GNAT family N-acetyltransferase [Gammaproteobacteria bacterium]|nr:GNAT family N-acetyltransferase [Gammaproteobacteria bacterium]
MSINTELSQEIVTKRLKLRLFRFSDVPVVFEYIQEPDMGLFLDSSVSICTEADTAAIIARHILVDRTQRNVWAITIDDLPVGGISINFAKEHRVAEIGYSVKKALWGQGYASEATQAVIDAAFETCPDLRRVQANIHPQNEGSIRVAKRAGMVYEGTLRSYSYVRGEVADEDVYAILRND